FSSRILVEKGRREMFPTPFSSRVERRKYSYSAAPTRSFAVAPKLFFDIVLIIFWPMAPIGNKRDRRLCYSFGSCWYFSGMGVSARSESQRIVTTFHTP